jgi:hypothetical protein
MLTGRGERGIFLLTFLEKRRDGCRAWLVRALPGLPE